MSINSAMLAGVSGLVANSASLASISDNIANVNTVGYKRNQTDFSTIVTATANRGSYSAGGVLSTTGQRVSSQGVLQQTTSATDLGISGQGFFVTTTKPANLNANDTRMFTRAGSYQVDDQGYLKNTAGLYLQGWIADQNGQILTNATDLTQLQTLNISTVGGVATPTTLISMNGNLQSNLPLSAAAQAMPAGPGAYNVATNNMSTYDPVTATGVKPDYSIQASLSDSKGGKHTIELALLRSATTPNQWYAEIHTVPGTDVTLAAGAPGATGGLLASGIIAFTPNGQFDPVNSTGAFAGTGSPSITLGPSTATTGVHWSTSLGLAAQTFSIDMATAGSGLTQFASPSSQYTTSNGTAFGGLNSIGIDENGYVTANFDNGLSRRIGQVALATFANPDGLKGTSGNAYLVSLNSGPYTLKAPNTSGAGSLSPATLEASTVDLSSEFTGLITTQRAYSASSKIITTADQMLAELLNIIR